MIAPRSRPAAIPVAPSANRMRLRFGVNETDNWWHFALGKGREAIQRRLRAMRTQVIRTFLFDKHAPDPVTEWPTFTAYLQAVLDVGARPMVTFARFPPPREDAGNFRTFVNRCADVVWGCLEQWGAQVGDWYWCIWNEPNNLEIGGGLTFAQYRRIYEAVASRIVDLLAPQFPGRQIRIGGPAVDGFQPCWLDWIHQLLEQVCDPLVGFVSWHRYGDWRPQGQFGAPADEASYQALLLAQTPDYEARARSVGRLIQERDVLNVCGEFNVLSHHEPEVSRPFNQSLFGAVYYASAFIHLLRGGADLEMWWTATDQSCAYGMMDPEGNPNPVCLARERIAPRFWIEDTLVFPFAPGMDVVIAQEGEGPRCGLFVHTRPGRDSFDASSLLDPSRSHQTLWTMSQQTGGQMEVQDFEGAVSLEGYGLALVTSPDPHQDTPRGSHTHGPRRKGIAT